MAYVAVDLVRLALALRVLIRSFLFRPLLLSMERVRTFQSHSRLLPLEFSSNSRTRLVRLRIHGYDCARFILVWFLFCFSFNFLSFGAGNSPVLIFPPSLRSIPRPSIVRSLGVAVGRRPASFRGRRNIMLSGGLG